MKYFYRLMALALAMTGHAMMAQEVSVEEAQSRALNFLTRQTDGARRAKGTDAASVQPQLAYTSKQDGKTCFYVFNAGADQGFVIVGGNEAAHEILGYSDHGTFDYDKAPANFKWWLSQYTEQIARAETSGVAASAARRAKAQTASRANIQALVKTTWNQYEPFNGLIPGNNQITNSDDKYVTGCVATAMAQVMYYHGCLGPATTGTGSHSYTLGGVTYSADFGATTYQWDAMLLNYETQSYTDAQAEAVATLMYHAGVSVDMKYGLQSNGGSSAVSEKIGGALVNYFGYDRSVRNESRDCYAYEEWKDLIYNELSNRRPVFYSGAHWQDGDSKKRSGHQFICDGYQYDSVTDTDPDAFHINWGWGGYCDGFYKLSGADALKPKGSGAGGGGDNAAYNHEQLIVINVMPDHGGQETAHFAQRYYADGAMYLMQGDTKYEGNYNYDRTQGSFTFTLYSTMSNISSRMSQFDYGVKAVETETKAIYYTPCIRNQEIGVGFYHTKPVALQFSPSLWDEGTYELRPVVRQAGGTDADWVEVDILIDEAYPTITISGELPTEAVYFTEEPYFNNDNNAYEDDLVFNFKIMNATSETASIGLYYKLNIGSHTVQYDYTRDNVSPDGVWSGSLDLSIWPQNNKDIVFTPNEEYTVYLYKDEERTELYNYQSITFTYRNKLSVDYGVSPAGWGTLILPFNAKVPEGMTVYECSSVTDGVLNLEEATTISRNVPYVVEGKSGASYSFVGPEAIDEDTPWFQKGALVGAVTKTVPLVKNTDYILQVQNDKAAFYKYTGTPSADPTQNADGHRLAAQFRAFLRLGDTTGAASYGLPDIGGNGIEQVNPDQFLPAGIYSIDGKRQSALQKGMNLLILDDGTARKVFVK